MFNLFQEAKCIDYIAKDEVGGLEEVLESVKDVNGIFILGHPLIAFATASQAPNCLDFLLRRGADPDELDSSGYRPLFRIIGHGTSSHECVKILLSHGADVNARNRYRSTVLHTAVRARDVVLVRMFLSAGVEVDAKDDMNCTALYDSFCGEDAKITEILLDAGAQLSLFSWVPDWVNPIVQKRTNFKQSYIALYGCFLKRNLHRASPEREFVLHKDIARILCSMMHQSRFDDAWSPAAPSSSKRAK
jgi:hypothetical protein